MAMGAIYNTDFPISYMNYCKEKHMNEIGTDMVEKWRLDTQNQLQSESSPEEVCQFFHIKEEDKGSISNKEYTVTSEIKSNDTERMILVLHLTLTISN